MLVYNRHSERIRRNCEFIIKTLGEGKSGEDVVFISDAGCRENAFALSDVAMELGLNPIVIDIESFGGDFRYLGMKPMKPLQAAIRASDLAFMLTDQMLTDFGMFLGDVEEMDTSLLGASRCFTLEARGLKDWDINPNLILHERERTRRLSDLIRKGGRIHVTTERGSDFTCEIPAGNEAVYPVMAIIPFYVEVAIIPQLGAFNGSIVADGASQCAYQQRGFPIRPAIPGYQELYMEPLRIQIKDGVVSDFSGPACQVERLKEWMYTSQPNATLADEIGIVTTTSRENDQFGWLIDGTHQTHCVHVALGNNARRNEVIHAPEHCDFDMHHPHVMWNGKDIYANGVFHDELIFQSAAKI